MGDSLLTEEVKSYIGRETGPGEPLVIEQGAIRKFIEAVEDENPIFYDAEYAKETWYGDVTIPPLFLLTNMKSGTALDFDILLKARRTRGEDEVEILEPVRVGDTISANTKIVDIYEKKGKSGSMMFILSETVYKNQFGRTVMISRANLIKHAV